jgi:predicted nuclease of predicted toxin-antitoxin system
MAPTDTMPTRAAALDVLSQAGPFLTAELPTPSAKEDAAERFTATVKAAVEAFERSGADAAMIERFRTEAATQDHAGGATLVVVVNPQQAWSWSLQTESGAVRTSIGSLPRLGRLLHESQSVMPHIVVLIDREGADIEIVHVGDEPITSVVSGDADIINRSPAGGWSQRRFQQRTENTWEENAHAVADSVAAAGTAISPAAVFVAGDERAVGFFLEHLPEDVGAVVKRLDHGARGEGADLDGMRTEVDHQLSDIVARHTTELLEEFGSRKANDLGVEGPQDTLLAVFENRADTLLVHADPDDNRTAFFGPEPGQVAADRSTFEALGIEAEEGPLVEVALRGAHATGSNIWFVPAHGRSAPSGGIGATLRG